MLSVALSWKKERSFVVNRAEECNMTSAIVTSKKKREESHYHREIRYNLFYHFPEDESIDWGRQDIMKIRLDRGISLTSQSFCNIQPPVQCQCPKHLLCLSGSLAATEFSLCRCLVVQILLRLRQEREVVLST